jgi:hypothetical protein
MPTSEIVHAAVAATAMWIVLFAAIALPGRHPALVNPAQESIASPESRGLLLPVRASTAP